VAAQRRVVFMSQGVLCVAGAVRLGSGRRSGAKRRARAAISSIVPAHVVHRARGGVCLVVEQAWAARCSAAERARVARASRARGVLSQSVATPRSRRTCASLF